MSLAQRLLDVVAAIGADIKVLKAPGNNQDQSGASVTNQTGFAADTYLAGSSLIIPQGMVQVGSKYRLKFNVVKTAAGVATPTVIVRIGTAGTIADAAQVTLTFAAQTAAIDEGFVDVDVVFRTAGALATLQAVGRMGHRLAATGLSTSNHSVVIGTSAAFNVTGANLKIGASVNGGASAAWTVSLVSAELINLAASGTGPLVIEKNEGTGVWPLRSTATANANAVVMWIGSTYPTQGGGYMISGKDIAFLRS